MHQAAVDFFQLLVQAGAVPGEDFSCDANQQAYRLNERCYSLLQTAYPDVDWSAILGDPQAAIAAQIEQLHEQLNCPFVDTLVHLMGQRLATLSDTSAIGYVQAILSGVEAATGIALYPLLIPTLDLAAQARLEWLIRQPVEAIPAQACLGDLAEAAGCTATDYEIVGDEAWLTEAGWQRIALVWDAECTLIPTEATVRSRH